MPLTNKGESILHAMEENYPSEEKAKQVFYASKNAGTITGVDAAIGEMGEMPRPNNLGESVLHAIDYSGEAPHEVEGNAGIMDAEPLAPASGGGNSGALISTSPGLGMSAYQNPKVPVGHSPITE